MLNTLRQAITNSKLRPTPSQEEADPERGVYVPESSDEDNRASVSNSHINPNRAISDSAKEDALDEDTEGSHGDSNTSLGSNEDPSDSEEDQEEGTREAQTAKAATKKTGVASTPALRSRGKPPVLAPAAAGIQTSTPPNKNTRNRKARAIRRARREAMREAARLESQADEGDAAASHILFPITPPAQSPAQETEDRPADEQRQNRRATPLEAWLTPPARARPTNKRQTNPLPTPHSSPSKQQARKGGAGQRKKQR